MGIRLRAGYIFVVELTVLFVWQVEMRAREERAVTQALALEGQVGSKMQQVTSKSDPAAQRQASNSACNSKTKPCSCGFSLQDKIFISRGI